MENLPQGSILNSGLFQNIDFLQGIPPERWPILLTGATRLKAARREDVIKEGDEADYFIVVLSGVFKIFKQNGNHATVFDLATRGDVIGALLMVESRTFPISAASVGESEYLKIPRSTYRNYWAGDSEILSRVQKATARRMEALQFSRLLQDMPADQKMAGLLLRLLDHLNAGSDNEIQLTRQELAECMGARVETVIRLLRKWQAKGWVLLQKGRLRVLRPDLLKDIF